MHTLINGARSPMALSHHLSSRTHPRDHRVHNLSFTPVIPAERVDVSIVVPVWRAGESLARCVSSLLAQRYAGSFEIVVAASETNADVLASLPRDPRLIVLASRTRARAAAARNRAAARAAGSMLAFVDADVVADPDWLQRMVVASRSGRMCVAGAVRNGTPASRGGTAEYLVEFLDFHPGRPPATAWHGATCSLLVPRALWEPFPEDMGGGEDTVLTLTARARGCFVFAPDAVVTHANRTRARRVLMHQFAMGRYVAQAARRAPTYPLRALVRVPFLAPVAVAARTLSVAWRTRAWMPEATRALPLAFLALWFWGAGLLCEELRMLAPSSR
jgi:glycosyltransferase AglI